MTEQYIHGFSDEEQGRLVEQAEILAPRVFGGLDFSNDRSLLEVGCAVGAELNILARDWPHLELTGLDRSATHLAYGRQWLGGLSGTENITLVEGDAFDMPFDDRTFDVVMTIWMLEHVQDHLGVMREALRVLKPDGRLIMVEVDNSTFGFNPPDPVIENWWDRFGRYQVAAGGDPFVGGKLKAAAEQLGARDIVEERKAMVAGPAHTNDRIALLDYLKNLLLSGAENMIEGGYANREDVEPLMAAFDAQRSRPEVSFQYCGTRLTCKPGKS